MKSTLSLCLFLFSLIIYGDKSYALTDYQIKKICKNERKQLTCIKNLKKKRYNLKKGKLIEPTVIPY